MQSLARIVLACLFIQLTNGQQSAPRAEDPRWAHLAAAVLSAADALGKPAVGNFALAKGTSDSLGSSNSRFREVVARMVSNVPPWSRAESEARAAASDSSEWVPPPPWLSIVGIGGSITNGRMLPDYCKECPPRVRYRHVWSGYLKRALEEAIYDASHSSLSTVIGHNSTHIGSSTGTTDKSDALRHSSRVGDNAVETQHRRALSHSHDHHQTKSHADGLGSFFGGKTVSRVSGSSAASLAVGHAGHPIAATMATLSNDSSGSVSGSISGGSSGGSQDMHASEDTHAASSSAAAAPSGAEWGDDGWAGQAVRMTTHGVNGANVCAFARHARSHVGQWLAENEANVLVVETSVNDALPPRFSGTHKCVEGLVRAAHAAHAAYRKNPNQELSVVFLDVPRFIGTSAFKLPEAAAAFQRTRRSQCRGPREWLKRALSNHSSRRQHHQTLNEEDSERAGRTMLEQRRAPVYAYPLTEDDVVLGAMFSHAQVASCYGDVEVSLAHPLAHAVVSKQLGKARTSVLAEDYVKRHANAGRANKYSDSRGSLASQAGIAPRHTDRVDAYSGDDDGDSTASKVVKKLDGSNTSDKEGGLSTRPDNNSNETIFDQWLLPHDLMDMKSCDKATMTARAVIGRADARQGQKRDLARLAALERARAKAEAQYAVGRPSRGYKRKMELLAAAKAEAEAAASAGAVTTEGGNNTVAGPLSEASSAAAAALAMKEEVTAALAEEALLAQLLHAAGANSAIALRGRRKRLFEEAAQEAAEAHGWSSAQCQEAGARAVAKYDLKERLAAVAVKRETMEARADAARRNAAGKPEKSPDAKLVAAAEDAVERAKRAEAAVQAKWDALKAADGAGAIAAVGTTTASSSASRTLTMASDDSGSGAASSSLQHRRLRLESGASYSDPSAVAACDGVHMTAFGHRLVAALLLQLVGEAIAIGPAAEQKSSLRPPKGAAQIPEALIASTPPLFNTLSELAEFSPVILLEGRALVEAVASAHCAVPGATARPMWRSQAAAASSLGAPTCVGQSGFNERGIPVATSVVSTTTSAATASTSTNSATGITEDASNTATSSTTTATSAKTKAEEEIEAAINTILANRAAAAKASEKGAPDKDSGVKKLPRSSFSTASEVVSGGLKGFGGWLACAGSKKSELESQGRHGCRQTGLYFFDEPLGQEVVVLVQTPKSTWQAPAAVVPAAAGATPSNLNAAVDAVPAAYRVSVSILRSYEGFGDVFVRVTLPDGRVLPLESPQPSNAGELSLSSSSSSSAAAAAAAAFAATISVPLEEFKAEDTESEAADPSAAVEVAHLGGLPYVRLPGWHPEHTSVPELLAIGLLEAPLPPNFNITLVAPDLRTSVADYNSSPTAQGQWAAARGGPLPHKDASKVVVTGIVVTPVITYK